MSAASFSSRIRGAPVIARRDARAIRRTVARVPAVTRANADIMSEVGTAVLTDGQLQGERYVASNRFRLQAGKGPTFEKRWAERKSRLANLDGFRFFTLMRRVEGMGGPPKPTDADENEEIPHLCDPEKPKPPALPPFALTVFAVTCLSPARLFE